MANNTCTICEFSTSIGIQIQSDGRWVSTGFQTGWKNNTYDSSAASTIPEPVRQAIANKEFKLAESDRSPFAVIGRLVKRQGYKTWAVVAFVILGVDNRGRDVPVYRYFCCEAEKDESALASMEEILSRVVSYSHNHGELPFFNPEFFELAKSNPINRGSLDSHITLSEQQNQLISTNVKSTNLVLPKGFIENSMVAGNAYTLLKLNTFTWYRAIATGQIVINHGSHRINNFAWAYNVELLERPDSFVIIQTANQGLKEVRGSSSDGFVAGVNEQGLKAAIKAITEPQQFKVEKVIELSTVLQDEKLRNVQFLNKVFEDLAGRGILPNSSHPNKIKLFILRVFLTSSATFNPFLKWFNQQDPQGGLVNIYKKFEQDFFNTIDDNPNECATLKEMVSGEICQAVLESLLVKREISPDSLSVLMQNSRWIKKQNLLDAIRDGITEVDSAIVANTPFSDTDIWKPLERFIENVQRQMGTSANLTLRVQSNSELPQFLKNILPKFITNDLAVRWRDINVSQKKRAEAKEQENRFVKAEAYYRPLAELLRMLSPNTDEYLYFDCISNPQKRFPLSYSAIGDADNTGTRLFNLTIGKPISIDEAENKLLGQQISFFFLASISVIVVPLFYFLATILVLITDGFWEFIKYIFNGFINILKQIIFGARDRREPEPDTVKNHLKKHIETLLSLDYNNSFNSKDKVLECLEGIERVLKAKKSESVENCIEFIKIIFEELESEFERKRNRSKILEEKTKFFRVYFLSADTNEISHYLKWFKNLRPFEIDRVLNFQNGFRKVLDDIKKDNQAKPDKKDYVEPFVKDVINFILSEVTYEKVNLISHEIIISWIVRARSFVRSRDLTGYVITDICQFIPSNQSKMFFLCDSNFWDELENNWVDFCKAGTRKTTAKYKGLAEFFENFSKALSKTRYEKEYGFALTLSAYFSQISYGYVSEKVFEKFNGEEFNGKVYELTLTSKSNDQNPPVSQVRKHTSKIENNTFEKGFIGFIAIALIIVVVFLGNQLFGYLNKSDEENLSNQIKTQPTFVAKKNNSPPSPSPTPKNNQVKPRLNCKASIIGDDLDLLVSNIPTSTKEIYSLMYVVKEQGKQDLVKYYPQKQPVNRPELTIKNLDGDGAPIYNKKYYIFASTKNLKEYQSLEELNYNLELFKRNPDNDICSDTITPQ